MKKQLRTAAYCRVSTKSEEQENSLQNQISYFTDYITNHPELTLVDIYAEKVSGTLDVGRHEILRLVDDVLDNKIDHLLVKSIHRLGRNAAPFIGLLRLLKDAEVSVEFIEESLDSRVLEGEFILIVSEAIAQQQSKQKSDSIKWGIRETFKEGKVRLNHTCFLGYTKDKDGNLAVVPEEAKIIRLIYNLYLEGSGVYRIKSYLERNQIKTVTGKDTWSTATIDRILSNEKYAGDLLLQKTYTKDFLTHKQMKNEGELPQYYIRDNHEPIVTREVFNLAQLRKKGVKLDEETLLAVTM